MRSFDDSNLLLNKLHLSQEEHGAQPAVRTSPQTVRHVCDGDALSHETCHRALSLGKVSVLLPHSCCHLLHLSLCQVTLGGATELPELVFQEASHECGVS